MGKQRGCYQTLGNSACSQHSSASEKSCSGAVSFTIRTSQVPGCGRCGIPAASINPRRALSCLTAGRLDAAARGLGARRGCWAGWVGQQLEEQRPLPSSERLPRDPGAAALPLHQLARPRRPLLRHRPPGLCPPGQVPQPPGSRAHSGPLQVSEGPAPSREAPAALLSR